MVHMTLAEPLHSDFHACRLGGVLTARSSPCRSVGLCAFISLLNQPLALVVLIFASLVPTQEASSRIQQLVDSRGPVCRQL